MQGGGGEREMQEGEETKRRKQRLGRKTRLHRWFVSVYLCQVGIGEFGVCMWGLWNAVVNVSVCMRRRERRG